MQGRKFYPVARVTSNRMGSAKYLFQDDFSSRFNWRENCFLYIRDSGFYQADPEVPLAHSTSSELQNEAEHRFGGDTFAKPAQRTLARTV